MNWNSSRSPHGRIADLLADAERSKGKMEGRVAGLVVEMRTRQTKQGKMMGFATLDDRTARLEVAAFSKVYEQYREVIKNDTILVVEGGMAMDDFSGMLRVTAEKVYTIEQAREMFARHLLINWQAPAGKEGLAFIHKLKQIIQPFSGGQCPVIVNYQSKQARATVKLGDQWRVRPEDDLLHRLRQFLSDQAVAVKYR